MVYSLVVRGLYQHVDRKLLADLQQLKQDPRLDTERLMASLEDVDRELGQLLGALFIAVPVGLAFSGAVSYFLARKALAPVGQLRRMTREITADRLDRRLTMRPLAEVKGVNVHTGNLASGQILGDAGRLRQIFYNLLDNAIKYTPPGGTVEVRLEVQGQGAVVTVRDNGIGIPPEHLPHVFDRFYRVDKARSRHFFYDDPKVYFMHIGGTGEPEKLAAAVKGVWDAVKKVRAEQKTPATRFAGDDVPKQGKIDALSTTAPTR